VLDVLLAAEYRRMIGIKGVGLICRIGNKSAITVFNCRNIFPVSWTLFYIWVERCPAFTFVFCNMDNNVSPVSYYYYYYYYYY
jgi:hypothetical protein